VFSTIAGDRRTGASSSQRISQLALHAYIEMDG
jgi:hypothetical protein